MARTGGIQIRTWMYGHLEDFRDECGDINATKLAEAACDALDGWDGDDIPEKFFEFAGEFAARDLRVRLGQFPSGLGYALLGNKDASWF